jgi:hypothetical protein
MTHSFRPNYWGRLPHFEIPHCIVQNEMLVLKPSSIAVLLILFDVGKAQQRSNTETYVDVKITQELLMKRSGFSKNVIPNAVQELERKKFIRSSGSRKKYGEFGANVYTLCNPGSGAGLVAPRGTNFLITNGVQYIKFPRCVVKEHLAEWSMAKMSSSELRLYVSICWFANKKDQGEFDFTIGKLKKLAGFSTSGIAQTALDGLIEKSLISVLGDKMVLHDPYTGEPLHADDGDPRSDAANYYSATGKGRATRLNLNSGDPQEVELLLRECGAEPISQSDGELKILCPFHSDSNPSCFVNPKRRCFYCHGCQKAGTVTAGDATSWC